MKSKIILILFSSSFLLVWGMSFLDSWTTDRVTSFLGMIYTFGATYFLQKEYSFQLSGWEKILILSCPLFYVSSYFYLHGIRSIFSIMNPLYVGFILLVLNLTVLKDVSKARNLFLFLFVSFFYAYAFYPLWDNSNKNNKIYQSLENWDTEPVAKDKLNKEVDLNDFFFINKNLDTINLQSNKFVLLETWNESCPPCVRAFKEMPPFYEKIKDQVDVFYLYENRKASVREKVDKIFNYQLISDKSKILIDINQNLYQAMKIQGYPYFLLFDAEGKLVFWELGFGDDSKEELEQNILKKIKG